MDFLRDTLASSRVIRACTLVDESTQEAHAGSARGKRTREAHAGSARGKRTREAHAGSARGKRTREALQVAEDTSYPGAHIVAALDAVTAVRGNPRQLICDNGPELFGKEAVGFWVHSLLAT
jgi:hypothetical protein